MKTALICDLHIGYHGTGKWHNRVMFDKASEITGKTVEKLNLVNFDLVIILGDITHNGTETELLEAYKLLSNIQSQWLILPGNHDRPGVQKGFFQQVFKNHIPPLFSEIAGISSLFIADNLSRVNSPRPEIGKEKTNKIVRKIKNQHPDNLLIFSHLPLICQKGYAKKFNAGYVPHYADGESLIANLKQFVEGKIISFAGHEHWHRIINRPEHLFCAAGALIEYPMEARLVCFEDKSLLIETLCSACPEIAQSSLASAAWVSGNNCDRNCASRL